SVDDSAGDTEIKTHFSFFNVIATIPFGRDRRIFTQIFYEDIDLENKSNKVSGSVKSLGLNTSYQWRFRFSRKWKPWFGAGLGLSEDKFTNRILLDSDGFIVQRFADRDEQAVNFLLNASTVLKRTHFFDVGAHAQVEVPVSGEMTRFLIAGTILF
ncbi:MAG: hypothetical protein ACE5F7_11555, partial [Nitrospiria bacterium]